VEDRLAHDVAECLGAQVGEPLGRGVDQTKQGDTTDDHPDQQGGQSDPAEDEHPVHVDPGWVEDLPVEDLLEDDGSHHRDGLARHGEDQGQLEPPPERRCLDDGASDQCPGGVTLAHDASLSRLASSS
jgi:hypothetical protein